MKGKFILNRPTVVKQSEEVSDGLELDASCRTDINSQGEGTFAYLKQGRWSKPKTHLT